MVAQTFVSLHLYGYGTVQATLQKIIITVYSMYMTTEGMEVQLCPRYEGQLNHMAESTPPPHPPPHPVPSPLYPHDTHHYSTDRLAKTDRLD